MVASTYVKIFGTLIFIITWIFMAFKIKWFPIGRTLGTLSGAVLLLIFNILSPAEAYASINIETIALLFGTMIITILLEREGFFQRLMNILTYKCTNAYSLLARVCLVSGFLSALVTNDTTCVFLTPVVVELCERYDLPHGVFLIGLATSANILSSSTPVGNPQNMIIASLSHITYAQFITYNGLSAIICLILNILLLFVYYKKDLHHREIPVSNAHFIRCTEQEMEIIEKQQEELEKKDIGIKSIMEQRLKLAQQHETNKPSEENKSNISSQIDINKDITTSSNNNNNNNVGITIDLLTPPLDIDIQADYFNSSKPNTDNLATEAILQPVEPNPAQIIAIDNDNKTSQVKTSSDAIKITTAKPTENARIDDDIYSPPTATTHSISKVRRSADNIGIADVTAKSPEEIIHELQLQFYSHRNTNNNNAGNNDTDSDTKHNGNDNDQTDELLDESTIPRSRRLVRVASFNHPRMRNRRLVMQPPKLNDKYQPGVKFLNLSLTGKLKYIIHNKLLLFIIVLVGTVISFILGANLGWASVCGAVIMLLIDGKDPDNTLKQVDWSLLVFFSSLFIVVTGFHATGLPDLAWAAVQNSVDINQFAGLMLYSIVIIIGSNTVSNVPLVLLLSVSIPKLNNPFGSWLILSFISTLAGNLTLVGSVANLIVCARAKHYYLLGFYEYFRFGFPTTLLLSFIGVLIMYGLLFA